MVLPIYKVLSLVIRVFSKPLITYTKQAHLKNETKGASPFVRKAFISLGNAYSKGEAYINRKFMNIQTQFAYKPLNDELAIEKGIQFFYQIIFYSLIIGLPLYEMMRASEESKVKSKALDQKLKKIDERLEQILDREKKIEQDQSSQRRGISNIQPALIQPPKILMLPYSTDSKTHKYIITIEDPVALSRQSLGPLTQPQTSNSK